MTIGRILQVAAVAGLAACPYPAFSQSYPTRPITLIVPSGPGGLVDAMARIVAENLASTLNQAVLINNRVGAGGAIAAQAVEQVEPDGHTLLFADGTAFTAAPLLSANVRYDPLKSFVPIAAVSESPLLLVVNPSVPARTCPELIDQAKKNPGKWSYASAGTGSPSFFATELFKLRAGINIHHVPYRGAGPAIADVVAGQVQITFQEMPRLLPIIGSGHLRPISIASSKRNAQIPEVPTIIECGYPGFVSSSWTALLAPASTSANIVQQLNTAVNNALKSPQVVERLARLGLVPLGGSPPELTARIAAEIEKLTTVTRATNVKTE